MMLNRLVKIKGGFVRAVKITDDLFDEDLNKFKLESYYVNPTSLDAFYSISKGLHPTSKNRVHLISGTYGSGKSHFGLVIANYLTKNSSSGDLEMIFRRIKEKNPGKADEIYRIRNSDRPYLVVLLEGYDADGGESALVKGLKDALTDPKRANLSEEILKTSYESSLRKIEEWEREKPIFIDEMEKLLEVKGLDLDIMKDSLRALKEDKYRLFKELHKEITKHMFIPEYNEKASQIYLKISELLIREHQYKGIAIIWDQFNEHLESTRDWDLVKEVSFLRDFTERVERSGQNQIHLILISHNPPHTYVLGRISKEALDNWKTFEGRIFKEHTITAVDEAEELISYAITKTRDIEEWKKVELQINRDTKIIDDILELGLFPGKDRNWIVETVYKGGFPLHPIATYCLPRISDVVGQEARTMFTFFEGDKEGGLTKFINENPTFDSEGKMNFYTADRLFDFFKDAIKNTPETQHILKNYNEALGKVQDSQDILTQRIMKALAVISNIKTEYPAIPLLVTSHNLALLLNIEENRVKPLLGALVQNEVLWIKTNGEYDFRAGQVIVDFRTDFNKEIEGVRWDNPIFELKSAYPPNDFIARGYEKDYRVTRKLVADYIDAKGLDNIKRYENELKKEYKDGFVLHVVAESEEEINEAKGKAIKIKNPQVVIAVPKRTSKIYSALKNIKALKELLKQNPLYAAEDTEAHKMWKDKYENEEQKIDKEVENWKQFENLYWFCDGETLDAAEKVDNDIADLVMYKVFNKTPIVEHRRMANRWDTDQRSGRINLNNEILDVKTEELRYKAKGAVPAEKTILEQTFNPQGMLKKRTEGNFDYYQFVEPKDENMKEVWDLMKKHLMHAGHSTEFEKLVRKLQLPPYGLSPRVIELFLSSFFRMHPNRFTIKAKKIKSSLWQFQEFTGETIYEMVNDPDPEKVLVEYREKLPLEEDYLLAINNIVSPEKDWGRLPVIDGVGSLFVGWFQNLPPVTKCAADLDAKTKDFLKKIGEPTSDMDMRELLLVKLPLALGIEKEFAVWDKANLERCESVLKKTVDKLNDYLDEVIKKAINCFKEIFDVKADTELDVMEKIKNWYNELDPAVKQRKFTGAAHQLLKYANIQKIDQFKDKFLLELPKQLGLSEFTHWENFGESLRAYRERLIKGKTEIEQYHKKAAKPVKSKKISKSAEDLKNILKDKIKKAGIIKEEIIILLEELLEEYKK